MNFQEFAEKHSLVEMAAIEAGKAKVSFGYFMHTVVSNDETVEVVTLSKDTSLFLSDMFPEVRRDFVFALVEETHSQGNVFHLVKDPNQHILCTLVDNGTKKILHIEKRG